MSISQNEILEALRAAMERTPATGGFTTMELVESSGLNEERVRRGLRRLLANGSATCEPGVMRAINGEWRHTTRYRLVRATD